MLFKDRFPVDSVTGRVLLISASVAVAPFTYVNALKIDAFGRVVIPG